MLLAVSFDDLRNSKASIRPSVSVTLSGLRFMFSQRDLIFDSLVTLDELFARHAINERETR